MTTSDSDLPQLPVKRRRTRQEHIVSYEELRRRVKDDQADAHRGQATDEGLKRLRELRDLHLQVQRERNKDTKVHLKDSEAFFDVSTFVALNARNVELEDGGVSLDRRLFLSRLHAYLDEHHVDDDMEDREDVDDREQPLNWSRLGALYLQVSDKAVTTDSLNGPLLTERVVRAVPQRSVDDTGGQQAITAREMQASEVSNDTEKNTAHMVRLVFDRFRSVDTPPEGVNFVRFFVNPHSFTQLVENLFYTSFLIKDGKMKLYMHNGEPTIRMVRSDEALAVHDLHSVTKHHIARLDMATWQACIDKYGITEPFLGHRDESEDAIPLEDL